MSYDEMKVVLPTMIVYQPQANKILQRDAKEALASWEARIADWAGVKLGADDILSAGGTCTDSGNDCDVD